jgi:hypothetical protein
MFVQFCKCDKNLIIQLGPPLFFCNLANLAAAKAKRVASLQSRKDLPITQKRKKDEQSPIEVILL